MPRHIPTGEVSAGEAINRNDGGNSTGFAKANHSQVGDSYPKPTTTGGRAGPQPETGPADPNPSGDQ